MLNWLKSVWAKWKIHITVVGGAVIVATTFGDCSFTPNLDGDDAAEEGATEVEVTPAATTTEGTATTEGETTTGATTTTTDGTTTTSEDN